MREEITLSAKEDNIDIMCDFVRNLLFKTDCPHDVISEISIVIDELFGNIIKNGYPDGNPGRCTLILNLPEDEKSIFLTFSDDGIPFDPTRKDDPDTDFDGLPPIGGFGIFLVKQMTDQMTYQRIEDKNVLTVRKDYL